MRRLYVPGPLQDGMELPIEGGLHQRLTRVLRLEGGDEVVLFDGSGAEWPARLGDVSKRRVVARLAAARRPAREPMRSLVIYQALIRPALFELVLEKGTELGVAGFVPLLSERSARASEASPARQERWQRVVIEAAEQSGRLSLPKIGEPASLEDALTVAPGDRVLAWERSEAVPALSGLVLGPEVSVFIGPEGGFSASEVEFARASRAQLAGLGRLILRSETAAIAAAALLLADR